MLLNWYSTRAQTPIIKMAPAARKLVARHIVQDFVKLVQYTCSDTYNKNGASSNYIADIYAQLHIHSGHCEDFG